MGSFFSRRIGTSPASIPLWINHDSLTILEKKHPASLETFGQYLQSGEYLSSLEHYKAGGQDARAAPLYMDLTSRARFREFAMAVIHEFEDDVQDPDSVSYRSILDVLYSHNICIPALYFGAVQHLAKNLVAYILDNQIVPDKDLSSGIFIVCEMQEVAGDPKKVYKDILTLLYDSMIEPDAPGKQVYEAAMSGEFDQRF